MSSIQSSNNNDTNTNTIAIYSSLKEYKEMMSPTDPNYCKESIENIPLDQLTRQAQIAIDELDEHSYPVFHHEKYSWGDCDEHGPTEHFWTLYIITENFKCEYTFHKFYREVYEMQGDNNNEVKYKIASLTEEETQLLNDVDNQPYELYNIVHNCSKYLSEQAETIIKSIEEEIVFVNEDCETGDYDKHGPREEYYTLYVFTRNQDGTINHRKFNREVYLEDDEKKVKYDEDSLSMSDFEKKFIL